MGILTLLHRATPYLYYIRESVWELKELRMKNWELKELKELKTIVIRRRIWGARIMDQSW